MVVDPETSDMYYSVQGMGNGIGGRLVGGFVLPFWVVLGFGGTPRGRMGIDMRFKELGVRLLGL